MLVEAGSIVLVTGQESQILVELSAVPILATAGAGLQLEYVLAAVGAAWALGISSELVCAGIKTFEAGQTGVELANTRKNAK